MKNIDFALWSFVAGSSLFLADTMVSDSIRQQELHSDGFVAIAPISIDDSYMQARVAAIKGLKAKQEELARLKLIKKCSETKPCRVMAEAIYFEGRGESKKGQIAIAQVIKKRTQMKQFPATIERVVYQKNAEGVCQFSYVCDIQAGRISGAITEKDSWNKSLEYAGGVLENRYPDYSKGADHYFNPQKVVRKPVWVGKMIQVSSIDNHRFLSSVRQL